MISNHDGKLIVFEGGEGAGKTTQIQRLQAWLHKKINEKKIIYVTREPGGTSLGANIRQLLLHSQNDLWERSELLLYAADRAQHIEEVLQPQLQAGAIILCDRFTDSTVAYQGYGRGLNLDLIHQLNQIATNGIQSDLTFWLDVEVEVGLSRVKQRGIIDRMEKANFDFHRRVHQGFRELAQAFPDRIVTINANLPEEEVQQQIRRVIQQRILSMNNEQSTMNNQQ